MENIIKDLRKEGVKVENMQATEWNALLKGKSISSSAGSTTRKAATKSRVDTFENAGGIYAQSYRYDQPDEPAGQCRYVEVAFVI